MKRFKVVLTIRIWYANQTLIRDVDPTHEAWIEATSRRAAIVMVLSKYLHPLPSGTLTYDGCPVINYRVSEIR